MPTQQSGVVGFAVRQQFANAAAGLWIRDAESFAMEYVSSANTTI